MCRRHHTRLLDLFLSWDTDSDGSISRTELERALKCLGIKATRGDIDDLLCGLDHSDTGLDHPDNRRGAHGATMPPDSISFRALQKALLRTEPKIVIKTKVKERMMQLSSERAAVGRQQALQVLLEHEQSERARVEERNAELESEVATLHRQMDAMRRERDQLRREQRASGSSVPAAVPASASERV